MLIQLLFQILGWVFDFFTMALLARVLMQWVRTPFRNPLGQFIMAVTDWAVIPARRIFPGTLGMTGIDLPSLLLAWLAQTLLQGLMFGLMLGSPEALAPTGFLTVLLLGLLAVLRACLYLLFGIVIVSALFSWVNPAAPLAPLFNLLSRPFLAPLQRFIPPLGGVDLSPMVLLLILQILLGLLSTLQASLLPVRLLLP